MLKSLYSQVNCFVLFYSVVKSKVLMYLLKIKWIRERIIFERFYWPSSIYHEIILPLMRTFFRLKFHYHYTLFLTYFVLVGSNVIYFLFFNLIKRALIMLLIYSGIRNRCVSLNISLKRWGKEIIYKTCLWIVIVSIQDTLSANHGTLIIYFSWRSSYINCF